MKKLILASIILVSAMTGFAQKSNYSTYVSVGSSLSSSTLSYGGEVGIYNDKAWFALGTSASKAEGTTKTAWVGSFKTYFKLKNYNIVDLYAYNGVNVTINKSKVLGFEPGLVTVFNVSKKWAPQLSLTAPVYENTNFNFTALSVGISLNYWIQ